MGAIEAILLGVGLSMDAFAVTISDMFAYRGLTRRRAMLMPVFFGLFQGLMPLIGYFAGRMVSSLIEQYAGILTLAILGVIGSKMIYDAVRDMHDRRTDAGAGGEAGARAEADAGTEAGIAVGASPAPVVARGAEAACAPRKKLTVGVVFLQAIATSIDALCVGVSLAAQNADPLFVCSLIALTTFALSLVAVMLGRRFGTQLGEKAAIVGGAVLIAIGLKAMFF